MRLVHHSVCTYFFLCVSRTTLLKKLSIYSVTFGQGYIMAHKLNIKLECGQLPNVMATLPNIGGALCSTPQSLADAHYYSAVQ